MSLLPDVSNKYEQRHEKAGLFYMRKQRRKRSADQRLRFQYMDSIIPLFRRCKSLSL